MLIRLSKSKSTSLPQGILVLRIALQLPLHLPAESGHVESASIQGLGHQHHPANGTHLVLFRNG